ncbi:MAG: hypothetical protein ACXIVQ_04340 [Acidimicrobiales bacterium]
MKTDTSPRSRRALIVAFLILQFGVPSYALVLDLTSGQKSWPWGWQMFGS